MNSDVNQRILEKIEKGSYDVRVKGFLKVVLGHELEHFSEAMWRFKDVYESEIVKAVRARKTP